MQLLYFTRLRLNKKTNIECFQMLWSFCAANCGEEKPFRLTYGIPGSLKDLEYESSLTFGESGLANSMISVTWSEV